MKKRFLAAGIALAISMTAVPVTIVANAEVKVEECDKIFAQTINSLINVNDIENGKVSATRKPLFDISIEPLGCVYEFTLKDSDGYAIVINTDGKYIAQEFIPEGTSPYAECEGKCVYVNNMTYLEYSDGVYTIAESGTVVPEEIVEYLAEDAFYGDGGSITGSATVRIDYVNRSRDYYRLALSTPSISTSPYLSSCACIAGANVVSYFDRYCPELIPDYEPGYEYLGYYFYYGDTYTSTSVVTQLYSDMGTTESNGTTTAQFLSGMTKYANRAGYNFSYTSVMSGSKLNFSAAKSAMKSNKPIALFLTGYNVAELALNDTYDLIGYSLSTANHVMIGFGYEDLVYTYDSGEQEEIQFFYVASGVSSRSIGYFNVNYNTKINDAYALSIY